MQRTNDFLCDMRGGILCAYPDPQQVAVYPWRTGYEKIVLQLPEPRKRFFGSADMNSTLPPSSTSTRPALSMASRQGTIEVSSVHIDLKRWNKRG